jgi:hypothetical protein
VRSAGRKGGRGEGGGAEEVPGAEVGQEDAAVRLAHEDIVAFDISVDTRDGVSRLQGASDAGEDVEHLAGGGRVLEGPVIKRQAVHPLHDEKGEAEAVGVEPGAHPSSSKVIPARFVVFTRSMMSVGQEAQRIPDPKTRALAQSEAMAGGQLAPDALRC